MASSFDELSYRLLGTPLTRGGTLSIQMVQNLTQYHISEYRLNLITSPLSDTQGITRTAIRVFCRLTARWVMGSYLLA